MMTEIPASVMREMSPAEWAIVVAQLKDRSREYREQTRVARRRAPTVVLRRSLPPPPQQYLAPIYGAMVVLSALFGAILRISMW
jgi:hypothetical protein